MSFVRPTLTQIVSRVVGDLETELGAVGSVLRRAMVRVLAMTVSGASHMLHGHLDFLARQIFPDTSVDEYLVRQGALYGLTKTPPTFARAEVEFTGDTGSTVPAGAILTRADGQEYELLADVDTITGTPVAGEVLARTAGAVSTLPVGTVLTLQAPVSGVQSTGAVTESLADGTNEETTEAFRARVLAHLADPPQGGNEADYIAWAKQVAGVTRAWVTKWGLGPGTVVVRFARDGDASPLPDSGEIDAVQAHLDEVAPVAAGVTVAPLTALTVDVEVTATPNTSAVRAAVKTRLQARLHRTSPSVTIPLSSLETAIGGAQGLEDFVLVSPTLAITPAANELPLLGTVTVNGVTV